MRLTLPCLPLSLLLITTTSAAVSKEPVLKAWEVLEGCHLIENQINDGDSFKVAHGDKEFIIRLYYVDCPETYDTYPDRLKDQSRYFSISESEMITFGKAAKTYTKRFLKDEFTVITCWEDARGGKDVRYFGMVSRNNQLLSSELVRNGLARIYGMPAGGWPGGGKPEAYLKQLKQNERAAQQSGTGIWGNAQNSNQLDDLAQIKDRLNTQQTTISSSAFVDSSKTERIILNTADSSELIALPGIGPVLADRIIAARPFIEIDKLADIPGISMKKVDALRHRILLDKPPPQPMTADFYLADSETYLNREAVVRVSRVTQSYLTAPDGFHSVHLETANQGESGGSIPAFIPQEYYDSFVSYYQQPNREFTGLLFQQDSNIVLVYRRK